MTSCAACSVVDHWRLLPLKWLSDHNMSRLTHINVHESIHREYCACFQSMLDQRTFYGSEIGPQTQLCVKSSTIAMLSACKESASQAGCRTGYGLRARTISMSNHKTPAPYQKETRDAQER